jgi:hypothetical protein
MKLKKITQKEFDELVRNEYGIKECPSFTDYTDINSFGESCSFGEWCSFGESCSFGEWCSFGESCSFEAGRKALQPYFIRINNIGSRGDGCIIFNFEDGIFVRSGCYFGSEKEFIARVKENHKGTKHEKEYLLAVKLAKITFGK